MTDQIVDRRLAGKNKSIGNRERFLNRNKDRIREAVRRVVEGRDIRDMEQGEDIHIPRKDISEPVFGHGPGGKRERVHPGNKEYIKGDRVERPKGGSGKGSGQASDSGEGEDDFVFTLTREEFLDIFFEDLALPNMIRTVLADTTEFKSQRAGFSNDGTPNNLALVRSMRHRIGRRIGTGIPGLLHQIAEQFELLKSLYYSHKQSHEDQAPCMRHTYPSIHTEMQAEIEHVSQLLVIMDPTDLAYRRGEAYLNALIVADEEFVELIARFKRIPPLDPIDMRYHSRIRIPKPMTKAVMFCVMDISGSMDKERKDLAKRFFILLYLFLTRHYEKIDIVFIRHHTQAAEVTEDEFFHSTETGGTVVSSALILMEEIIRARYPTSEWNIYGAQASDGDNYNSDSPRCRDLLINNLLPLCQYFAYVQVVKAQQNLWDEYATIDKYNFAMKKVEEASQIYPVFRELFKKEA
jgi:uncharacterized sporulation protein YeaH/YhbH (DUF444 family)